MLSTERNTVSMMNLTAKIISTSHKWKTTSTIAKPGRNEFGAMKIAGQLNYVSR